MAGDVVLRAEHVVKSFRIYQQRTTSLKQLIAAGGRNKFTDFIAVNDLSFEVREGEVFGVIGQNGSGKSTLLKCMAGILRPNSGSIAVNRRLSALLELGAGEGAGPGNGISGFGSRRGCGGGLGEVDGGGGGQGRGGLEKRAPEGRHWGTISHLGVGRKRG